MTTSPPAVQEWERRTEWPLAGAAALFLIGYSWLILSPGLGAPWRLVWSVVDYGTWTAFVIDFVVRVKLATPSLHYFSRHIPELLIVVLPVLRPLRLLRLVALLRVLDKQASHSVQGRVAVYISTSSALVVYSGALAVLSAERGARGANIETFGTSLWWAITTVTTVGYGDYYPVTTEGRFVAAALMIAGVALVGAVTASIASWLVDRVRTQHRDEAASGGGELAALRAEIRELRTSLTGGDASSARHESDA